MSSYIEFLYGMEGRITVLLCHDKVTKDLIFKGAEHPKLHLKSLTVAGAQHL